MSTRWLILTLLFAYSFIGYLLRTNISVAGKFMMADLGLNQVQMGWVFSSFLLSYSAFQLPGGALGDRFGPRMALTGSAIAWGLFTIMTGFLPALAVGGTAGILASLLTSRFLLGAAQAPTFPVAGGTVARWFPKSQWAFANSLPSAGLSAGSAFTAPFVVWLIAELGWRGSFYATAPAAFLIAALLWWYVRDSPEEHPRVTREELLALQAEDRTEAPSALGVKHPLRILLRSSDVILLTLSYLAMNYVFYIFVFWFFIYLVDVRKLSILSSGFSAAIPFLVGAVLAAIGGRAADVLGSRMGCERGYRMVAVAGLMIAAGLLLWGIIEPHAALAVVVLSLCFGFTLFTDAAYWAAASRLGGSRAATACGVLNTGGNLGGVLCTPLIPVLVKAYGWVPALATGSVVALFGASLWFLVRLTTLPQFASSSGDKRVLLVSA